MHTSVVYENMATFMLFLCPFFMSFILSDKYQKIRWRAALDLPILSPLKYSCSKPPTLSSGEAALWLPDSVAPVILLGSFWRCLKIVWMNKVLLRKKSTGLLETPWINHSKKTIVFKTLVYACYSKSYKIFIYLYISMELWQRLFCSLITSV